MKYPIYIASTLLMTIGASWASPPSKNHQPNLDNLREQRQERLQHHRMVNRSADRPTTVALNVGQAKNMTRNQFQTFRHRNKGH